MHTIIRHLTLSAHQVLSKPADKDVDVEIDAPIDSDPESSKDDDKIVDDVPATVDDAEADIEPTFTIQPWPVCNKGFWANTVRSWANLNAEKPVEEKEQTKEDSVNQDVEKKDEDDAVEETPAEKQTEDKEEKAEAE